MITHWSHSSSNSLLPFQLTNPTSLRSDRSEYGSASDDDTLENLDVTGNSVIMNDSPPEEDAGTPTKSDIGTSTPKTPEVHEAEAETITENPEAPEENSTQDNENQSVPESHNSNAKENALLKEESPKISQKSKLSPTALATDFLRNERCQKSPQKPPKFGRKLFSALSKTFSRHKSDGITNLGMLL